MAHYASKKKLERSILELKFPRIAELPFDSKRKCMTTIHHIQNPAMEAGDKIMAIVKGGVEVLFEKINDHQKAHIPEFEIHVNEMAKKG